MSLETSPAERGESILVLGVSARALLHQDVHDGEMTLRRRQNERASAVLVALVDDRRLDTEKILHRLPAARLNGA